MTLPLSLSMRIAARSVVRNWRHSIATLLSIALSVVAIASIRGYIVDVDDQFGDFYVRRGMTGHVIVEAMENDDDDAALDAEASNRVIEASKKFQGRLIGTVRFLAIEGIIAGPNSSYGYSGLAYDVLKGEVVRGEHWAWNTGFGTPLNTGKQNQIVVGKGLAELLGCKLQGLDSAKASDGRYLPYQGNVECLGQDFQLTALTDKSQMNAWDAKLVGIVDAGIREMEDSWIMMPLDQAQSFLVSDRVTMIGFTLENSNDAQSFISDMKQELGNDPGIKISFWRDHKLTEVYRSMMGVMDLIQVFMLLVVASVSILSMVNSITRNIDERQKEIGTLRAIGYENGFVSGIFAWEGFFLGLAGTIIGTMSIVLILSLLNGAKVLYYPALISQKVPLRIAFVPGSYLVLAMILAIGSALTALVVARLRIGKNIADILR
ncbi:MAG: ABC transporter permease [Proteobacteria bacterium]|nr:MAG: ABC transporter permease [Pseudomonadota bacterium]